MDDENGRQIPYTEILVEHLYKWKGNPLTAPQQGVATDATPQPLSAER
jgi:hypothetical protein